MRRYTREAGSRQRGVGLIEVMIALVVLAVGILAILGMQISSKQSNFDAVQRTTASHLASDLIERMRANPLGLSGYLTGDVLGNGSLSAPSPACISEATACTRTEMAEADLYQWELAMDGQSETRTAGAVTSKTGGLVNARACLTGPGGGGTGTYVLTIVWRGAGELEPTALGNTVCGGDLDGTTLYGTDADNTDDRFRRVAQFTFFITV